MIDRQSLGCALSSCYQLLACFGPLPVRLTGRAGAAVEAALVVAVRAPAAEAPSALPRVPRELLAGQPQRRTD
ncbi:hypothetical protein [Micromonospora globbae]|uniref:hypothetical protein n=1 Tax=Micromonospora globbae TaxID=1894969 RepID=UPI001315497C|nr:hypothetical protein [Micromonospora globbae]